jgi:hypothetical protein
MLRCRLSRSAVRDPQGTPSLSKRAPFKHITGFLGCLPIAKHLACCLKGPSRTRITLDYQITGTQRSGTHRRFRVVSSYYRTNGFPTSSSTKIRAATTRSPRPHSARNTSSLPRCRCSLAINGARREFYRIQPCLSSLRTDLSWF